MRSPATFLSFTPRTSATLQSNGPNKKPLCSLVGGIKYSVVDSLVVIFAFVIGFFPPKKKSVFGLLLAASYQPLISQSYFLDHATTMIRRAGCQLPITRFRICNLCRFLSPNIRSCSGCRISGCNCSRTLRNLWHEQFAPSGSAISECPLRFLW